MFSVGQSVSEFPKAGKTRRVQILYFDLYILLTNIYVSHNQAQRIWDVGQFFVIVLSVELRGLPFMNKTAKWRGG